MATGERLWESPFFLEVVERFPDVVGRVEREPNHLLLVPDSWSLSEARLREDDVLNHVLRKRPGAENVYDTLNGKVVEIRGTSVHALDGFAQPVQARMHLFRNVNRAGRDVGPGEPRLLVLPISRPLEGGHYCPTREMDMTLEDAREVLRVLSVLPEADAVLRTLDDRIAELRAVLADLRAERARVGAAAHASADAEHTVGLASGAVDVEEVPEPPLKKLIHGLCESYADTLMVAGGLNRRCGKPLSDDEFDRLHQRLTVAMEMQVHAAVFDDLFGHVARDLYALVPVPSNLDRAGEEEKDGRGDRGGGGGGGDRGEGRRRGEGVSAAEAPEATNADRGEREEEEEEEEEEAVEVPLVHALAQSLAQLEPTWEAVQCDAKYRVSTVEEAARILRQLTRYRTPQEHARCIFDAVNAMYEALESDVRRRGGDPSEDVERAPDTREKYAAYLLRHTFEPEALQDERRSGTGERGSGGGEGGDGGDGEAGGERMTGERGLGVEAGRGGTGATAIAAKATATATAAATAGRTGTLGEAERSDGATVVSPVDGHTRLSAAAATLLRRVLPFLDAQEDEEEEEREETEDEEERGARVDGGGGQEGEGEGEGGAVRDAGLGASASARRSRRRRVRGRSRAWSSALICKSLAYIERFIDWPRFDPESSVRQNVFPFIDVVFTLTRWSPEQEEERVGEGDGAGGEGRGTGAGVGRG